MRPIINRFNYKVLLYWWKLPILVVVLILAGWFIYGCGPKYPFTVIESPSESQEAEFKDPLAIDYRQKKSVTLLVSRYGDPEIFYSWADDDFNIEVLRWKNSNLKHERWAIRINDVYKFTWTQFKSEKEEVKK